MKAISIGSRYEIYDDTLKAYDGLPGPDLYGLF